MNSGNIIKFPVDRTKGPNRRLLQFDPDNIRVVLTAALVTVLVAVPTLNWSIFSEKSVSEKSIGGRGIASVDKNVTAERERLEKNVMQKLSSLTEIVQVQVGHKPKADEALRYEGLEGKYVLEYENGKLVSALLRSGVGEATLVKNNEAFLTRYANSLVPGSITAEKVAEATAAGVTKLSYVLKGAGQTAVVELDKDSSDHLLQLRMVPQAQ